MIQLFNSINSAFCGALGINSYLQGVIIITCINVIAVLGMSILTGFTRLFSFGNAGFMSIGAYTAAILTVQFKFNFLLAILCGALFAGLIAFLLGSITLRLKGDYFLITCLGSVSASAYCSTIPRASPAAPPVIPASRPIPTLCSASSAPFWPSLSPGASSTPSTAAT